jgi:signal transduction histidine kinase
MEEALGPKDEQESLGPKDEQESLGLKDERNALLSELPADAAQRRLAFGVLAVSVIVFVAMAPFAKTLLAAVPAFLPTYQSALVVNDLITAVLLFGQFRIVRRNALLVLACAYLFSSMMAVAHALSFPGLFLPPGALGVGPQTTAWLYFLWHGAFPMFILAYALLPQGEREQSAAPRAGIAIAAGIGATLALACAFAALTTVGHDALPAIMAGDRDASTKVFVATASWVLCVAALVVLWRRRPHSVLDLWLMVVLCVWIFDIALASVLNAGRYDLGWYAGRVYGLLAACFVLVVLLLENGTLYSRMLDAYSGELRERQKVQEKSAELASANKELEAFSYSVSHDLRAPLRHIGGFADMLEADSGRLLTDTGRRHLEVIRDSAKHMGQLIDDLLRFSRLGRQALSKQQVDMAALAREVAAELGSTTPVQVEDLPAALADLALMRQVWRNLVGNAVKYSGKRDDPRVEIGARREGAETVYWVRDNGAGFDMRYAERLFGVFQRLHSDADFPGTGVGLAIVQRVVARHGGRVWAEGRPKAGAVFYFSLPAT